MDISTPKARRTLSSYIFFNLVDSFEGEFSDHIGSNLTIQGGVNGYYFTMSSDDPDVNDKTIVFPHEVMEPILRCENISDVDWKPLNIWYKSHIDKAYVSKATKQIINAIKTIRLNLNDSEIEKLSGSLVDGSIPDLTVLVNDMLKERIL